jgi:hypothetical protein
MGLALRDTQLKVTKALPNGATNVTSDAIDLGHGSRGDFLALAEVKISAPALVVGDLANSETMKYDLIHSDNSDLSSPSTLITSAITQTGAASAGAVAATFTGRLSLDVKRYIGVKATNSGAGDASDKSVTLELLL